MQQLRIKGLHAEAFTLPFARPIGSALGTYAGLDLVLVTLETEDGPRGTGFTAFLGGKAAPALRLYILDELAPLAIGQDALAPESLWHSLWGPNKARMRGGIGPHALSAIDIACWDLVGKAADMPLWRLLGGAGTPVPVYGSGGWLTLTKAELVDEAQGFAEQGIEAYKFKVGQPEDEERVALLRRELGDDFTLLADANQGYSVREAVEAADMLSDYGVTFLEEPVLADSVDDIAEVAQSTDMAIACGENAYFRWGFREICERRAAAFLQPDATRCGGVTEWRKAAHLAEAHNLALSSHLFHELHVSLMAASPAAWLAEYMPILPEAVLEHPYPVVDGCVAPHERPGHGLAFDRAALARLGG